MARAMLSSSLGRALHRGVRAGTAVRRVSTARLLPDLDTFPRRHIGPSDKDTQTMLAALKPPAKSLDEFVRSVIPENILTNTNLRSIDSDPSSPEQETSHGVSESRLLKEGRKLASMNEDWLYLRGMGYYGTHTPGVIKRNVLENPGWYTSYTPYQPEISQGRLESLLNFQTMVSDLTGLPMANASLLDEGTAAAEAMTMSVNALPASRAKRSGRTYLVDRKVFPNTISVLRSRAEGLGIHVRVMDLKDESGVFEELGDDLMGVLVQYPDVEGVIRDFRPLIEKVHKRRALFTMATDPLALTLLTPPGELGADIAVGSAQRFGVPLGNGGPHAAFIAVRDEQKRRLPGRLVGVSKDRLGNRALRLALQTREQHIRREKATSNVCTAQALLANMAAMYAIYHGPEGLREIAEGVGKAVRAIEAVVEGYGFDVVKGDKFGAVGVVFESQKEFAEVSRAMEREKIAVREEVDEEGRYVLRMFADETTDGEVVERLGGVFRGLAARNKDAGISDLVAKASLGSSLIPESLRRTSSYLTHPVFNTHHSETELLRYIHQLQAKDLSLVHSMIPLGSCTMKLNATTQMALLSLPGFSSVGPVFAASPTQKGYAELIRQLSAQLAAITGMAGVSLQPNSGAQGEFAGLRVIRKYHEGRPGAKRDICLIPVSAHGTNPASAAMAGMRVVPIKCDAKTGNLDVADLEKQCDKYKDTLGAIMITYPSTFGVFEPEVKRVCEIVHQHGGLVYMDGANMNAQIGLCSPGEIGADVCHLNLHKTFCIPHGGGGPGVGPICVKEELVKFLPGTEPDANHPMVASAPYGSASILPISWAYNKLMGSAGLRRATALALLNANYLLSRLSPHYPILYTNSSSRCAHEFILDVRPFHATAGIEAIDIAKRLQDYGFHAPTMSWPVAGTLMIEPTESESLAELERFVDALVGIREEIAEVERGEQPREGNVLKMAPHTWGDVVDGDDGKGGWGRTYSREKGVFPRSWVREKKFWPSVARVDDTFGDRNLFCTCPPVEDTTGE